MTQSWLVRTVTSSQQYVPYDSIGMNRFIVNGFKEGPVFVNGEEVVRHVNEWNEITWKLK